MTLEASPGAEKFAEWEGCDSEPSLNECEVAIPAEDATVKADFVEAPKGTLTVEATGEGSVDATEPAPSSGEISGCEAGGGACSAEYFQGETVTLAATPGEHQQVAWIGCDAEPSANECEVEVDAAEVTVEAAFTTIAHELTVAVSGQGTVGADSGAISECREASGTCAGEYVEGTLVTLEATPDAGHELTGWEGCDSEPGGSCQVTMGEAREVKAAFAAEPEEEKEEEPEEEGEEGGGDNGGGSTPPPPPPPATCLTNPLLCQPGTLIAGRVAKVKGSVALLRARCLGEPGASCAGLAKLYAKLPSARKGRKARRADASARRAKRRARLVPIGKARFALPASASSVLRVRIANGKAKRLLRNGRALKAQLRGAGLRNRVVVLKPATKKRKRAGKRR